jgi:imidazolonepropionase
VAWDILIRNIQGLVQVRDQSVKVVAGKAMAELPVLTNAYLAIQDGKIQAYGSMSNLAANANAHTEIDATGRFVFPSFVDSHTHLVFAASREEEFVMKLKGATYEEISAKGGGILNSARK